MLAFLLVFGESGILPRLASQLTGISASKFSLDGIAAIVVVHVYSFNVYFYLFLAAALRRLDGPQVEASSGLGASPWRTFRSVVFPELRPALLGASILTFLSSMASFSAPLLFAGGHRFITLQIFTTKMNGDLHLAAAQSLALTLVSMGFFVALQVFAGSSISTGRSKGSARAGRLPVGNGVRVLLVSVTSLIVFLEMLPLAVIFLVSFAKEGSWTWQLIPDSYTLENYRQLFADPHVFRPIRNSVSLSLTALAVVVLVGVGGSYLSVKGILRRVRVAADVVMSLPYAIPGTVLAIALILAFNHQTMITGYNILVGTFWILPLAYILRTYPLMIRSVSASLAQLDDSLLEAADSVGAGELLKFRRVIVPMILPGIVAGASLTLVTLLGEFVSSVLLYTYATRPIAVEILAQVRSYNLGAAAAYCVLLLLLILAVVGTASAFEKSRMISLE